VLGSDKRFLHECLIRDVFSELLIHLVINSENFSHSPRFNVSGEGCGEAKGDESKGWI
jgi:hypothetical protein